MLPYFTEIRVIMEGLDNHFRRNITNMGPQMTHAKCAFSNDAIEIN